MIVNPGIILWIFNYLSDRPQYTNLKGIKSYIIVTNTGAPQGCVLSTLLFTLYTNNYLSSCQNCLIIKNAGDSLIAGKIGNDDNISNYISQVNDFVNWCELQHRKLNVKETIEMIFDLLRRNRMIPEKNQSSQ